jgi:hypothetical protein
VPFRPGDPLPWARYFPSLMAAPAA